MLTNDERQESLRIFSELYANRDFNIMVQHMPLDTNDPEGEKFNFYFDFLQSLYSLRSDIQSMQSEDELDERLEDLIQMAQEFDYPMEPLEVFYG
jgi:hypothetical protein